MPTYMASLKYALFSIVRGLNAKLLSVNTCKTIPQNDYCLESLNQNFTFLIGILYAVKYVEKSATVTSGKRKQSRGEEQGISKPY